MERRVPLIAFVLVCHACGSSSTTSDAGEVAQDAGGGADAGADRPESGTSEDGGETGAVIIVRRAGLPVGARIDLGQAEEGTMSAPFEFELANTGDAAFEVAPIELIGGQNTAFVIGQPANTTVAAGGSVTFTVAVRPPAVGDYLSRVEIRSAVGATRVATFEVFGRGTMVVIGSRKIFAAFGMSVRKVISEDGMTWTDSQFENQPMGDNDFQFRGSCYGGGIYVGVGGAMLGRIAWSRNGTTWTDASDDRLFLGGCAYGNGYFVAVGSSGRHIRSTDGATWTDPARTAILNFRSIAFGGGRFVAVGDGGRRDATEDGVTWTDTSTGGDQLWSVGYGVDRFVAVGVNGRRILTTDGGRTWTNDQSDGGLLRAVAYGNGTWVAVGQNRSLTSPDGITWTEHAVMQAAFSGLAFGDGKFVGVGYPNRRFVSTDGVDWGQAITDSDPVLVTVTFGTGQ